MELLVLFGVLFAMLVIGVPVAFSLLAAALACFLAMDIPPIVAVQRVAAGISVFTLMAIPFFIFAGDLMYRAGIADRLVRVADAAIGRVRGGLGIVDVGASMMFGAVSGSAIASASASDGALGRPRRVAISPAVATALPVIPASSACAITTMPSIPAYCSSRSIVPESPIHWRPVATARAPASRISAISASDSPPRSLVAAASGWTQKSGLPDCAAKRTRAGTSRGGF